MPSSQGPNRVWCREVHCAIMAVDTGVCRPEHAYMQREMSVYVHMCQCAYVCICGESYLWAEYKTTKSYSGRVRK